jgi:transglutaminase-like putative cysteine protease
MRLDLAFRLSTYLTLGSAAVCLGYAEESFLPGIGVFVGVFGVFLATTFFLERRWALRPLAANLVGLLIFAGTGLWIAWSLLRPSSASLRESVSWPTALLPYVGPLLMILVLAKLMRPKHSGDYWALQGMAVLQVALACALANDPWSSNPLFGLLLLVYMGCGLWWLLLFYPYRGQTGQTAAPVPRPALPWRWLGLGQAGLWFMATIVLGIVLFLITPRSVTLQQPFLLNAPASSQLETGYSPDSIDLNRTGKVQVNKEVALIVNAAEEIGPNGVLRQPKLDLDSDQLWRGATLHEYYPKIGRWQSRPVQTVEPPPFDLGRRFYLVYTLNPSHTHGTVLAEPVFDVVTLTYEGEAVTGSWYRQSDGIWKPRSSPMGTKFSYRQVTSFAQQERELSPPVRDDFNGAQLRRFWDPEKMRGLERADKRLRDWTQALLRRLATDGHYNLTLKDLVTEKAAKPRPQPGRSSPYAGHTDGSSVLPENYEKVARALSKYLSESGDYTFTLDLRRQDLSENPVEDFVFNVKQGHCERFATALAMMLRTQGIPAQLVVGFRGAEARGDGVYYVRHSQAHSWVEALVWRPNPAPGHWHWLTLDPTPAGEAAAIDDSSGSLWGETWDKLQRLWRNSVIDYNPAQLENLTAEMSHRLDLAARFEGVAESLQERVKTGPFWIWSVGAAAAVLLGLWSLGRVRRQRAARGLALPVPGVAFYARLLTILQRHIQLRPQPQQTPREFADAAGLLLVQATADGLLAAIPGQVVRLFYRVRYGEHALSTVQQRDVDQQLDQMEAALATARASLAKQSKPRAD